MSERDDKVYIRDILDSIKIIEQHVKDISLYEFDQNILVQDAVIRRLEIIGEASSKLSEKFKNSFPDIEWRLMSDMRNKLIHEYFGVSINTLYNTLNKTCQGLNPSLCCYKYDKIIFHFHGQSQNV